MVTSAEARQMLLREQVGLMRQSQEDQRMHSVELGNNTTRVLCHQPYVGVPRRTLLSTQRLRPFLLLNILLSLRLYLFVFSYNVRIMFYTILMYVSIIIHLLHNIYDVGAHCNKVHYIITREVSQEVVGS